MRFGQGGLSLLALWLCVCDPGGEKVEDLLWLMWFSGLIASLQTERSPARFLGGAYAWVADQGM